MLTMQQHEFILYPQRFSTHSIRTIQQMGTTRSVSMAGAEPLNFALRVLWSALHLRYSSLSLSQCSFSSQCLHAWLRASKSSSFPVSTETVLTQLVCTLKKCENFECQSKNVSTELEIFHALFSFLEGFLSQYLVLKSNILANRRLCHFVAMKTGLFVYGVVWSLFGSGTRQNIRILS